MPSQISPLQVMDASTWKGLTTENHLGAIWELMPQKASDLITMIQQSYFGNNLDTVLAQFPTLEFDTDDDFEWELQSQGLDNIPLIEARIGGTAVVSSDTAGINFTTFELVFDQDFFSDGEVIVGHQNEVYPIIIESTSREGNLYVHTCKMNSSDPTMFIPYDEIVAGKKFSGEFAPVERTMSRRGREIRFKSHLKMRNSFSQIRIQKKTPGNMKDRKMGAAFVDDNGKVHKMWTHYESFMFDNAFREDKNKLLMFGTSNKGADGVYRVKGLSGYDIKQGAGIRQQMESANTSYYSTFDIDDLASTLLDLSEGKLASDNREFVLRTGERGAYEFHKALERYTQLFTPLQNSTRMYSVDQKGFAMGQGFGGQFIEYRGPNNIKVNLSVDSMYDDRNRNKEYHPNGGVVESYRFDIMDIGTMDGKPNIQKVGVKGFSDVHRYIEGFRSPYSPDSAVKGVVSSVDAWEEHKMFIGGAIVRDPSRTASLINNLQA